MSSKRSISIALIICLLTGVLVAQSFQDAGFKLPYTISALNSRTAHVPSTNCIYVFGGYANNTWANSVVKINLNSKTSYQISERMPVGGDVVKVGYNSDDGLVYLFSGKDVYYFNPSTEKFTKKATGILQEIVGDYATLTYATAEKAFYIFGNRGSARGNFTLKYTPATNSSSKLSNALQPSNNTSPAASYCQNNNLVYLFGGNYSSSEYDIIQKFSPTTSSFTTLSAKLSQTTGGPNSIYVPAENSIYIIGGFSGSSVLKRTYKFNCSSENIASFSDLPETRHAIGLEYVENENRIYAFGGTISSTGGYGPASDKIYYLQLESGPSAPFTPDANTVALYHLDENSGTKINDASGNANHGTSYGPNYVTGKFSKALRFDGYDDYCKILSSSSFKTINSNSQLTIDVWININQYPSAGKEGGILSKWGAGGPEDDEWLLNLDSNGKIRFHVNSSTSSVGPSTQLYTNPISKGVFHLISAVWNGRTKEAAIYVDGNRVAYTSNAVGTMPATSEPIDIGSDWVWYRDGAYNGVIDEIRISNIDRYLNSAPTPTITVVSPNGGETWYNGETHTITWSSQNHQGNVKIDLYRGNTYQSTIISGTSDDGSFTWTIPTNLAESNQYRIKITSLSDGNVSDFSDSYFTIKNKPKPTITVTNPNGGEIWYFGESKTISWTSNDHQGNVKIELFQGTNNYRTIISGTSDDGNYTWTVPSSYAESSQYRIKITSLSDGNVSDFSDSYFTIKNKANPEITVTRPNGGEIWHIGEANTISWASKDIQGNVKIELFRGSSYYTTISSSTSNDGSFVWSIPTNLSESSQYRVKISSLNNTSVYDFSDNYFTINKTVEAVPITPVATTPQYPNAEFWVDINVGNASQNVSNLKIVSFELSYTNTNIIDYMSYQTGSFLTNSTATVIADDAAGSISASVYKTSGGNSGHGTVLQLRFKIKANASNNQSITFTINEVQANDANGQSITLSPGSLTVIVQSGLLVWPGDANNDGRVTIFDINAIVAMHWNKTGPVRPNATVAWQGQPCSPWSPADATYADCNGDGKVSIFDINPVVINFGKTHSLLKKNGTSDDPLIVKNQQADPDIYFVTREYDETAGAFWVDIVAGSPQELLQDLKVISFELSYTNTAQIDYDSHMIGAFPSSSQATIIADDPGGMISASVYRSDAGETGWGTVLSLKFKAEKDVSFEIKFNNVLANNSSGQVIPLESQDQSITTSIAAAIIPEKFEIMQNYPNPFNPSTTIEYSIPHESHVRIEVFNALGHRVRTLIDENQVAGRYTIQWQARNDHGEPVASGLYYYSLKANDFNQIRKMLYMK